MTITQAIACVRQAARNAASSSNYSDAEIVRAISAAGNEFVESVRCCRAVSTVPLVSGDYEIDTSVLLASTGFYPSRVVEVWQDTYQPLVVTDYRDILKRHNGTTQTGRPELIGWLSDSLAALYPAPDATYAPLSLQILWHTPFTVIDPTSYAGATQLNVPEDMMHGIVWWGAPSYLQHTMPEQSFTREAKRQFAEHIAKSRGRYGVLGKVMPKGMAFRGL